MDLLNMYASNSSPRPLDHIHPRCRFEPPAVQYVSRTSAHVRLLTSAVGRAARFVSPPEIGFFDSRTVFLAVKVSPRIIVAIRHPVLVTILKYKEEIINSNL